MASSTSDTGLSSHSDQHNLAILMKEGKIANVNELRNFVTSNEDATNIDQVDDQGRTPLMIACRDGNKEITEFLLEKGSNPNMACTRYGNTPLHYLCEGDDEDVKFWREQVDYPTERMDQRKRMVQLLLDHGAVMQNNSLGLKPSSYAGIHSMTGLVDYFVSSESMMTSISKTDRITALELLGASQSTLDLHHARDAYDSFYRAMLLRYEDPDDVNRKDYVSDLKVCFNREECKTTADLDGLRRNDDALKIEGFLVSDRILPEELKTKFLWHPLMEYAQFAIFDDKNTDAGSRIFSYRLSLESASKVPLGSVLDQIANGLSESFERIEYPVLEYICRILESYSDILSHGGCIGSAENIDQLLKNLGSILFYTAYYFSKDEVLDIMCRHVEQMLTVMRRIPTQTGDISEQRVNRSRSDLSADQSVSVTHMFIEMMLDAFVEDCFVGHTKHQRDRLKRVICRLLHCEGACHINSEGDTMLHTVMYLLQVTEYDLVLDLTQMLVRHGCPISVKNNEGETPVEIPPGFVLEVYDEMPELKNLLQGPTCVLDLEELAARTVLRYKIPYRNKLPGTLREIIEGDKSALETYSNPGSGSSQDD